MVRGATAGGTSDRLCHKPSPDRPSRARSRCRAVSRPLPSLCPPRSPLRRQQVPPVSTSEEGGQRRRDWQPAVDGQLTSLGGAGTAFPAALRSRDSLPQPSGAGAGFPRLCGAGTAFPAALMSRDSLPQPSGAGAGFPSSAEPGQPSLQLFGVTNSSAKDKVRSDVSSWVSQTVC